MIAGSPTVSSASSASSKLFTVRARAQCRPIFSIATRNSSRSSAFSMESGRAPIISTPNFSSVPSLSSARAVFSAVWPPMVGSSASGRSASMMRATVAGVIGSI